MKIARWDSGIKWDDPNFRWSDPSYILEKGDPGYVETHPDNETEVNPTSTKKGKKNMSNNPITRNLKVLLALGEGAASGCAQIQDEIKLKQTRQTDLTQLLQELKGNSTTVPSTLGLIYLYDQSKLMTAKAEKAVTEKDEDVRVFLTDARDILKKPLLLGPRWSPQWVLAGYTETGSTAVPNTQDERYASISAISVFLAQNPTFQVPGGSPQPEITSSRAHSLHSELRDLLAAANSATREQAKAKKLRDAAADALRARLIALVDELTLLLSPDDSRWEIFGFNIPNNPRAPEPASALTLSRAGDKRVLAEWVRGIRSDDNRILIQITGVDSDWRELDKSGNVTEYVLKNLTPGSELRVKIISLNGSLEAPSGPEAQIVVE